MTAYADILPEPPARIERGKRWPIGCEVPEEWIALGYALRKRLGLPRINLRIEAESFADYWASKTGKDACKLDWLGTWRNWCRNARGTPEAEPIEEARRPSGDKLPAITRTLLALKGARTMNFCKEDVEVALKAGAITAEQARRLGL